MELIQMIAAVLVAKLPVLGEIGANALAICLAMNLVIELAEALVALTASVADDAVVAKVKALRNKVLPILEIIPHTNVPVAAGIEKAIRLVAKVVKIAMAALKAAKEE
jgi:hypothetical protein